MVLKESNSFFYCKIWQDNGRRQCLKRNIGIQRLSIKEKEKAMEEQDLHPRASNFSIIIE